MQTCSICNALTNDLVKNCINCGADLSELSTTRRALKRFQENQRISEIRLIVMPDACPACQDGEGTYSKQEAPILPIEGCSHPSGCRCFYEPVLAEIYP
jgi:hypothetical protein